jgi:hypothetical protein
MKRALYRGAGLAVLAALTTSVVPASAHPVNGNLPGGTSIAVSIDSPAAGTVRPPGAITVDGTASVGQGEVVPSTALVYVLDVSNSTQEDVTAGCGGDQNNDGDADNILDCEVLAARTLNDEALSPGTAGTILEVGAVAFADGATTADVGPAGGEQLISGPGTNADGIDGRDINQVLNSAFRNTGNLAGFHTFTEKPVGCCVTNFAAAITSATTVANAASAGLRRIVVFLSDGEASAINIGPALAQVPENVDFYTFAVGDDSNCASSSGNSLRRIADETGGTCTEVPEVADLPDILPDVINSQLTSLVLRVDGGAPIPVTNLTPGLPREGPTSVNYSVNTPALGPGTHQICVTATGSDGGGTSNVTDCHTVVILVPAEAWAISTSGLVTIAKTPHAVCPPDADLTQVGLNVPGVADVNALNASCLVSPDTGTNADASIDGASLLGGAIRISTIESSCDAGVGGLSGSSRVGTINGTPIGTGAGQLSIPLVATVFYNETVTTPSGQLFQHAIRVRTVLGQEIILSGCRVG